jgi:hypothetical protein
MTSVLVVLVPLLGVGDSKESTIGNVVVVGLLVLLEELLATLLLLLLLNSLELVEA